MENVFQQKKSVSITFPLGQTGQIKCGFILLWPIPVQLMQADTLMLILCDDWDAAAVINVFFLHPYGLYKANRLMSLSVVNMLKLHVKKQKNIKVPSKYFQL